MILGSIYVTAGAIIVGVPIGVFTAVFMAKICPKPIYKILKPAVDLLAGIPSVVYGFFGMVTIVPFIRNVFGGNGSSMLAAALLLGLMILPTIIGITETAIRAVPNELYDGAVALGASHIRAVFSVILPAAKSGILSAVVLGIGRAIGETMAVIMVAGNQAIMPSGLLDGVRTLTSNIVLEMGYASGLHREALIATGVVLFVFILLINLLFSVLRREKTRWEEKLLTSFCKSLPGLRQLLRLRPYFSWLATFWSTGFRIYHPSYSHGNTTPLTCHFCRRYWRPSSR